MEDYFSQEKEKRGVREETGGKSVGIQRGLSSPCVLLCAQRRPYLVASGEQGIGQDSSLQLVLPLDVVMAFGGVFFCTFPLPSFFVDVPVMLGSVRGALCPTYKHRLLQAILEDVSEGTTYGLCWP